jgi:hypothetical protein
MLRRFHKRFRPPIKASPGKVSAGHASEMCRPPEYHSSFLLYFLGIQLNPLKSCEVVGFPFLVFLLDFCSAFLCIKVTRCSIRLSLNRFGQLPFAFCNLAGKDAGQNSAKMLRGLNANVTYLRVLDNCLRDSSKAPEGRPQGSPR